MWWLIIQRFPQCRNPFMAIFNGLHKLTEALARENQDES